MCVCVSSGLTPQKPLTLFKADSVRVTLLGGSGAVALRDGHDSGSIPHQELAQGPVVARGRTVQRGPGGIKRHAGVSVASSPPRGQRPERLRLPAVAVRRADVGPAADQKVHHAVVAPADGVVKRGDAFVVGLAGVHHLHTRLATDALIPT